MDDKHGVLLALSSLPGRHGIGDFGEVSYRFIDWLEEKGYRYWQVLPLNPLGPGFSPYMSSCSNAIEYRYISLDLLIKEGYLNEVADFNKNSVRVDYYLTGNFKKEYLYKAYLAFQKNHQDELDAFSNKEKWVIYYATYETFKRHNDNKPWNEWEIDQITYFEHHSMPPKEYFDEINFIIFIQYIALKQWKDVLSYARKKRVQIICDMPFYVGFDGVECWMHKEQFSIDENYHLFEVGGVGPDGLSEDGQLWGTPIYNFIAMEKDHYSLLVDRIGYLLNLCDILRLDHFRAFDTYYVIDAKYDNARIGEWRLGPSDKFFDALYQKYPHANLIAEDLGDLRREVLTLRDKYHMPGMFISEFTIFDLKAESTDRQIVYPGNHDNDTLWGWYINLDENAKQFIEKRLKVKDRNALYDAIFDYIWNIKSYLTIFQLQDLLKLDNSSRMNYPGTTGSPNWEWKLIDLDIIKDAEYPKKW